MLKRYRKPQERDEDGIKGEDKRGIAKEGEVI